MNVALVAMSHSPLLGKVELASGVEEELERAFGEARDFARSFDPEVVINFAPDHYNGFFYRLMPPHCIGYEAVSIGDYGSQAGRLDVPRAMAEDLAAAVMDSGLDLAVSLDMQVDHGAVQPLEILFDDITARPVIPFFINSVAPPFVPVRRARLLGEAVGRFLADVDRRVLVIASGGLSHDPPAPRLVNGTPDQLRAMMGDDAPLSEAARAARQERVIAAAARFAAGESNIQDLAPSWDEEFMALMDSGRIDVVDSWTPEAMASAAGNSSHEVRTWIAGFSALAAVGPYRVDYRYYRPIRELIAGFAVMTAMSC